MSSLKKKRRLYIAAWFYEGPLSIQGVADIVDAYDNGFDGTLALQVPGCNPTRCLTVLPNGNMASGRYDGIIDILDGHTGVHVGTLGNQHEGPVSIMIPLPHNRLVTGSSAPYSPVMCLWDVSTGACLRRFEDHYGGVQSIAVWPEEEIGKIASSKIASSSCAPYIRVWDASTGKCLRTLEGHTTCASVLMALPDQKLASGSDDKTVRVWNLQRGGCDVLQGHNKAVTCLAILHDSKLASGSLDTTVRVWSLITSQCLHVLMGHAWGVWGLALMPDGELVSAGNDYSAVVWDVNGARLRTLQGHQDIVFEMAVLPDGKLVSASRDSTVRVWDVKTGHFTSILQTLDDNSVHMSGCRLQVLPNCKLAGIWFNGAVCVWE